MGETALCGILIVHKHAGVTSNDIVQRLRRLYGTRQVGHTGTLDPMATGVLPVLIGRAVKASDFIMAENKRYTAEMHLGLETDTEDSTGTVLRRCENMAGYDFLGPVDTHWHTFGYDVGMMNEFFELKPVRQ